MKRGYCSASCNLKFWYQTNKVIYLEKIKKYDEKNKDSKRVYLKEWRKKQKITSFVTKK